MVYSILSFAQKKRKDRIDNYLFAYFCKKKQTKKRKKKEKANNIGK